MRAKFPQNGSLILALLGTNPDPLLIFFNMHSICYVSKIIPNLNFSSKNEDYQKLSLLGFISSKLFLLGIYL